MTTLTRPPQIETLDVRMDLLDVEELNDLVAQAVDGGQRWIIANHNLHSVYLCRRDARMREFFAAADYIHIDGMPLVYLAKLLGERVERRHRVTYVDWTPKLIARAAAEGWRVFYLGSKPGVAERGARLLRERHPTLAIATHDGYFDAEEEKENARVREAIVEFDTQVLMVGMGMPRQEHWILRNLEGLGANAILPAGAAMDYVAGAVPTPPRWTGRVGVEWLYRLAKEPRRLSRRYLVEPWSLLAPVGRDLLRSRARMRR